MSDEEIYVLFIGLAFVAGYILGRWCEDRVSTTNVEEDQRVPESDPLKIVEMFRRLGLL